MLRVEHLKVGYMPPRSFEVADGRCLAIEGPSGAGKTRLLRAIADLDKAAGQVFLDGAERREMPAPAWRRLVRYSAAEPAWWTDTARPAFPQSRAAAERIGRLMVSLGLEAVIAMEDRQQILVAQTGDMREGVGAFLEKRKADYRDA